MSRRDSHPCANNAAETALEATLHLNPEYAGLSVNNGMIMCDDGHGMGDCSAL